MAYHFDSEQFNRETTPKRLGNFQVPRWAPTRPRLLEYRPNPKPICDSNGHFLPGAPRGTSKCFGHFTGTWELPTKITRKVAAELAKEPPDHRFPDWVRPRIQRPEAAAKNLQRNRAERERLKALALIPKTPFIDSENKNDKLEDAIENKIDQNVDKEEQGDLDPQNNDPLGLNERIEPVDASGHQPYIPGSLTEPEKRHESFELLVKDAVEKIHGPQEDEYDKFWRKVAENANAEDNDNARDDNMKCEKNKNSQLLKLPQVNFARNFEFAKQMRVGNLEHQPLPDTLGYRNLSKIAEHRESDIVVKPYAIGWKGYGASGPTCCTKMRVHRPKTSDPIKADCGKTHDKRPCTSAPDLKGYQKPMSLMDLAIGWDFKPEDSTAEPRRPKHIDGSNGSQAPAVFTLVHTAKDIGEENQVPDHSQSIFTQNRLEEDAGHHPVPYFEKDMSKEKRKDSCDVQYCAQHSRNEKSSNSAQIVAKPQCDGVNGCGTPSDRSKKSSRDSTASKPQCDGIHDCGTANDIRRKSNHDSIKPDKLCADKEAWNSNSKHYDINRNRNSLESYEKTPLAQGKLHQSSPNDSQGSRHSTKDSDLTNTRHKSCLSCNGTKIPQRVNSKEDYKFAFKAGNPNSVQSTSSTTDSKVVKIPKMRHPYTKKCYSIPTLAPPFSIWGNVNATGYPDHWRLASVYQHAFKPPEMRRKPLIASVYQ